MNSVEVAFEKGYRCDGFFGNVISPSGKSIKTRTNRGGYPYFSITFSPWKKKTIRVHRLQAFQKYGTKMFDAGIEVRHKNGVKSDASEENILIGTRSENHFDKTPEMMAKGGRAGRRLDYAAVMHHYDKFGYTSTIRAFRIFNSHLNYIIRATKEAA